GEFIDGIVVPRPLGQALAAQLDETDGICRQLYAERAVHAPNFSIAEIRLFRRAVRHMAQAERIAAAARRSDNDLPRRVLDSLPLGVLVVDATRKLHFANAAAETVLSAGEALTRREERLQAARAFETGALTAALSDVAFAMPPRSESAVLAARA